MTDTVASNPGVTPDADDTIRRRGPRGWLHSVAGDGPLYALLILFGLNAVDELDRTAFGILAPEIREEFGLGSTAIKIRVRKKS